MKILLYYMREKWEFKLHESHSQNISRGEQRSVDLIPAYASIAAENLNECRNEVEDGFYEGRIDVVPEVYTASVRDVGGEEVQAKAE